MCFTLPNDAPIEHQSRRQHAERPTKHILMLKALLSLVLSASAARKAFDLSSEPDAVRDALDPRSEMS